MTAREKMASKIASLTNAQIEAALVTVAKTLADLTVEEMIVRSALLQEYEARNGYDATDAMLDKLEELAAA